jgi:hypothetical protein
MAAGRDPVDTDLLLAAKTQRLRANLRKAVQNNLSDLLCRMQLRRFTYH